MFTATNAQVNDRETEKERQRKRDRCQKEIQEIKNLCLYPLLIIYF